MAPRRHAYRMSNAQWALLCGCAFVITMGAGLGVLTPPPHRQAELVAALRSPLASSPSPTVDIEVIRPGQSATEVSVNRAVPFRSAAAAPATASSTATRFSTAGTRSGSPTLMLQRQVELSAPASEPSVIAQSTDWPNSCPPATSG